MEPADDGMYSERYLKQLLQAMPAEELGSLLKTHRLNAGLTIRELAERAMLSKTSIVAIERGRGCRPVTLEKVCRALRLHVERITSPDPKLEGPVQGETDSKWYALDRLTSGAVAEGPLSQEDREKLLKSGAQNPMVMFGNVPAGTGFIAGIVEFNHPTEPRSHPGAEFGYVLEGCLLLRIGDTEHRVDTGNSFFVADQAVHSYSPGDERLSRVLLFRLA